MNILIITWHMWHLIPSISGTISTVVNLDDLNHDHKTLFTFWFHSHWLDNWSFLVHKTKEKYGPANCSFFSACNLYQMFPCNAVEQTKRLSIWNTVLQLNEALLWFKLLQWTNFTILSTIILADTKDLPYNHIGIYFNRLKFNLVCNLSHLHSP